MHIFALTQMTRSVQKPFVWRNRLPARKFAFDFLNALGTGPRIYVGEIIHRFPGHIYIYVLNENPRFMTLGAKTMCNFCGSSVFWKLGCHLSLWIPWWAF